MKRFILLIVLFSGLSFARNDIPSCYDALQMNNPNKEIQKELFILVDQTTILDKNMMIYTYKNMMKFIKNGNAVTIASFSSNAKGKYTDVAYSGKVESLLPKSAKHNIAKKKLRKYEACMNGQYKYAKKKATKALVRVLKEASKQLPHSDIVRSLDDISKHIISNSSAKEKIVLIVSDMIEHSSITSFYSKGTLKTINIKKELTKVKKSGHLANFAGAKVYIIGAGITSKNGYRDSKRLGLLSEFWKEYFALSNAKLEAIGIPMLLEDIQ
jgi:hypothetical protein